MTGETKASIAVHREIESLHRGMILELDRAGGRRDKAQPFTISPQPELEREIVNAVTLIRSSAKNIDELRQTLTQQDVSIKELRRENAEFERQSKIETENFIAVEKELAFERERAERAERHIGTLDSQLRKLEDYCALLQQNISRMTGAVHESLASMVASNERRFTA